METHTRGRYTSQPSQPFFPDKNINISPILPQHIAMPNQLVPMQNLTSSITAWISVRSLNLGSSHLEMLLIMSLHRDIQSSISLGDL